MRNRILIISTIPAVFLVGLGGYYLGSKKNVSSIDSREEHQDGGAHIELDVSTFGIRNLTENRRWENLTTSESGPLISALLIAFREGVLRDGMDLLEFQSVFGTDFDQCFAEGDGYSCYPLEYTWESLPDLIKNSSMGQQWYLLFFIENGKVSKFKLRYGSPKSWRYF